MDNGFLKIPRSLLYDTAWTGSTASQKGILITLYALAAWRPRAYDFHGTRIELAPGQVAISENQLCEKCGKGASRQVVRTALRRFEKLSILTKNATNGLNVITLTVWEDNRGEIDNLTNITTNIQPTFNQDLTNIQPRPNQATKEEHIEREERKERKNVNISAQRRETSKNAHPADALEVEAYFNERAYNFDHRAEAEKFFDFYESKGWMVGKSAMKDWQAAARNWAARVKERPSSGGKAKSVSRAAEIAAMIEEARAEEASKAE